MGWPIVEIVTSPITGILSDLEAPKCHRVSNLRKQLPQLSPHFYQPRLGYLVIIIPPLLSAEAGLLGTPHFCQPGLGDW